MGLFDGLKAALAAKAPTSTELETAVEMADRAREQANADLERLEGARQAMLVAPESERTAHKAALAAARDRAEDAALYVLSLSGRLEEARSAEAEQARRERYAEAERKSAAAAKRLRTEYPKYAAGLVDLLAACTEAEAAVRAVNEDLPSDVLPLIDPETAVRDRQALPPEVIKDRITERWCFVWPVAIYDGPAPMVLPGTRKATVEIGDVERELVLRRVRRVERYQSEIGLSGSRLRNLYLPGLRAGDPSYWEATGPVSLPHLVAEKQRSTAEARRRAERPVKRETEINCIILDDEPDDVRSAS